MKDPYQHSRCKGITECHYQTRSGYKPYQEFWVEDLTNYFLIENLTKLDQDEVLIEHGQTVVLTEQDWVAYLTEQGQELSLYGY